MSPRSAAAAASKKMRHVALLHPDLGIGGAEQLMLNIGQAFQSSPQDFSLQVFTPFYDPTRCLEESKTMDVHVVGTCCGCVPRTCRGRCTALLSYLRMTLAALYIVLFGGYFDAIILDQVPLPIPLLRLLTTSHIVYYCHHPDLLLCTERASFLKWIYRMVIDTLEEYTTGFAHKIFVNSKYTQDVFYDTFPLLKKKPTEVLYPAVDLEQFRSFSPDPSALPELQHLPKDCVLITSLNRYERKKKLKLVLEVMHLLHKRGDLLKTRKVHFCIAGGYDPRVTENVEYHAELQAYAKQVFGEAAGEHVTFLRSISNQARKQLLKQTQVLLYTPENEHFGMVPLEGMYNGCVVIACNSGGPTESIVHSETGFLLPPEAEEWAKKVEEVIQGGPEMAALALDSSEHVQDNFGFGRFKRQLITGVFGERLKRKAKGD